MKQISGSTFLSKKLAPTMLLIFLGSFVILPFLPGGNNPFPFFILLPLAMIGLVFILFRKIIWDVADAVYDNGDELIFRKGRKEQSVKLNDIINISYSRFYSNRKIKVHVKSSGEIGNVLSFWLPVSVVPLKDNPVLIELLQRVDRARKQ